MKKIRVVKVPVHQIPEVIFIKDSLEKMQSIVGGLIEYFPLSPRSGLDIICNEEGKINGMEGNRLINGDLIAGDFIVVGNDGDGGSRSLTDTEIEYVLKRFNKPEYYTPQNVEDAIVFEFIPLR